MTSIARGQAIMLYGDPLVHSLWLDDAEHDDETTCVVAFCGAWNENHPTMVAAVERDVDCMACLAHPAREVDP